MASPRKKRTMSVAHSQQLPKNCVNDKMLSIIEHEGSFLGVELCQNSFNDHDALVKDYPAARLFLLYFTFVNMLYQNYKKS